MPERLISTSRSRNTRMMAGGMLALGTKIRARNALIRIRSLLDADLLGSALTRAAASRDEPEETRSDGESDSEPEDREHVLAEMGLDVVRLEDGAEDADERGVDGGGGDGSAEDEDGRGLRKSNQSKFAHTNLHKVNQNRAKLTVETIVVTKLPHRLKIAKMPTMISAIVVQSASTYATNIHLATFRYASSPSFILSEKIFCAFVSFSSQASIGLNQKEALRGVQ